MADDQNNGEQQSQPIYRTLAELHDVPAYNVAASNDGLSKVPGLREVPNSTVPADATGKPIAHVVGPQQNPVDPVAAGISTAVIPVSRQENRVITQTGADVAGPRPHTYVQHTGLDRDKVPQAGPADYNHVPAQTDYERAQQVQGGKPLGQVSQGKPVEQNAKAAPPQPGPTKEQTAKGPQADKAALEK